MVSLWSFGNYKIIFEAKINKYHNKKKEKKIFVKRLPMLFFATMFHETNYNVFFKVLPTFLLII